MHLFDFAQSSLHCNNESAKSPSEIFVNLLISIGTAVWLARVRYFYQPNSLKLTLFKSGQKYCLSRPNALHLTFSYILSPNEYNRLHPFRNIFWSYFLITKRTFAC